MAPPVSRRPIALLAELGLMLMAVAVCWWLAGTARQASLYFTGGVILLIGGRLVSARRGRDMLPVPLLLPAATFACLLGMAVHARTAHATAAAAPQFAQGFLLGCAGAAVLLALPRDPLLLAGRLQPVLLAGIVGVFAALALFGSGPAGSGTRINLGPVQPIEIVKPAFVLFLAVYLGRRAGKLRWQRRRLLLLRWPRPKLLMPAIAVLAGVFAGLFAVGDLGPTLILSLVFLGMFFVVTRSSGWAVAAIAVLVGLFAVVAIWPELTGSGTVATRITMWRDPWHNGLTHGHQLAEGLWALNAGGWTGQGLGQTVGPPLPAGMTDLILATMGEQLGLLSIALYLALVGAIAATGFAIAARNRTPERMLAAAGLAILLLAQWAIIHAGTTGTLPLTGVVVPFLSSGRSSMVAFLLVVGLLARLAEDARPQAASEELTELRASVVAVAGLGLALLALGLVTAGHRAVVDRQQVAARGIVRRLSDGTLVHRQNPRLLAIAGAIRRGTIEDRDGRPIAVNPDPAQPGQRSYPLGADLGTVIGIHSDKVMFGDWALERRLDHHLRGYGERPGAPRYADFGGRGRGRMPWPDLRPFVPLLDLDPGERSRRIAEIDADLAARSVRLSLDARLQQQVAAILRRAAGKVPSRAAAAVVIDVDTGHVLARAQTPDLDLSDRAWQESLEDAVDAGDRAAVERFQQGAYGEWPDKTGTRGVFQVGSVGKLVTALAAARRGWTVRGAGCDARVDLTYACTESDDKGPLFTLPDWKEPIHDHAKDSPHGTIDVVDALAVSCNVYFGQLALELGPDAVAAVPAAGVDLGWAGRSFLPGAPGSRTLAETGFGQGGAAMSVLQAGRLVAALAAGGVYRRCSPDMRLHERCPERRLIDDPDALAPIVAGMRKVMTGSGTGWRLRDRIPRGLRVYGKTGTADVPGFQGEEPHGIARGARAAPHSWFVAFAEPEQAPACASAVPGRIAVAVVVPRGGMGGRAAGEVAMEVLESLVALGYLRTSP